MVLCRSICRRPGTFRLIATAEDGSRTELQFPVSTGGRGLTHRMNRPERLDIQLDRKKYKPGETAAATITSPFAGTALVCLEADGVLSSQVVELKETSATARVNVPATLRGGAFVSATLLRAIDPKVNSWLPHRARGIVRLETDHESSRASIEITAAARVDLKDELPVSVTTEPGTLIHLWAVDEGILATSGFQTPDPLRPLFRASQERSHFVRCLSRDCCPTTSDQPRCIGSAETRAEKLDRSAETRCRQNVPSPSSSGADSSPPMRMATRKTVAQLSQRFYRSASLDGCGHQPRQVRGCVE